MALYKLVLAALAVFKMFMTLASLRSCVDRFDFFHRQQHLQVIMLIYMVPSQEHVFEVSQSAQLQKPARILTFCMNM